MISTDVSREIISTVFLNIGTLLIGNTSYKGNTDGHIEHFSGNVAVGLVTPVASRPLEVVDMAGLMRRG